MTVHKIPAKDWPTELASALRQAKPGDTIVVDTETRRDLALNALERRDLRNVEVRVGSPA